MSQPTSPSSSSNLRRRSQLSPSAGGVLAAPLVPDSSSQAERERECRAEATEAAVGAEDSVRTPTQPITHRRQQSDGFGAFVDAGDSSGSGSASGVDPWGPLASTSHSSDEDWHEASLVTSFSPPSSASIQPAELPDWDAWDSRGPSNVATPGLGGSSASLTPGTAAGTATATTGAGGASSNPADDAFFAAFERAAVEANARAPSPPVIDLRPVERKLDAARGKSAPSAPAAGASDADLDFFAQFERADSMPRRKEEPGLLGQALEHMTDARTSPMLVKPAASKDYFGDEIASPSSSSQPRRVATPEEDHQHQQQQAGSWAGSLKRTWGSIRGLPAGLVEHLPSATDFIVPPDEGEAERRGSGASGSSSTSTSGAGVKVAAPRRSASGPKRAPIPHASDYSHASPFGGAASPSSTSGGGGGFASGSFGSGGSGSTGGASRFAASQPSLSIPGAPGFDATSERRWNTGSWSLTSAQEQARTRRPIDVTMQGRRVETDAVLTQWHASRLQASLPPRSQLGTTWKLLYSLDQHGISLATLYANVASGLSSSGGEGASLSPGLEAAEGWMRGASSAAKAAMGTAAKATVKASSLRHVGGGLALADAGIVIAVQDADDNVFGAYLNEKLRPQSSYYGSGECFLWKTTRSRTAGAADGEADAGKDIRVFRWTGANDYVALTEAHYLSVGGGNDGRYGLWLDGKLEKGVSARSTTFDNNVLCDDEPGCSVEGKEGHFECLGLEVWAVGID